MRSCQANVGCAWYGQTLFWTSVFLEHPATSIHTTFGGVCCCGGGEQTDD